MCLVCVFGVCVCFRGRGVEKCIYFWYLVLVFFLLLISLKPSFPHFPVIN